MPSALIMTSLDILKSGKDFIFLLFVGPGWCGDLPRGSQECDIQGTGVLDRWACTLVSIEVVRDPMLCPSECFHTLQIFLKMICQPVCV